MDKSDPPLVVVIEDHDDSRELLEECLRLEGFQVLGRRSAEEAMDSMLQTAPAAVISDLTLPGMSGEELAERVRREHTLAAVPIIALSGRSLDPNQARIFDDVLMKPADVRVLGARVRSAIQRAQRSPHPVLSEAEADLQAQAASAQPSDPQSPKTPPPSAEPPRGRGSRPAASDSRRLPLDQYRLLVEHAPTMMWRAGTDTLCDWFNEAWLDFSGRTMAEESGNGWAEGVHPEDLALCLKVYSEHFEGRRPFEMEYRLKRHDGVYRWLLDRGAPFYSDDGEFGGFIGSCIDIDERRQADLSKRQFLTFMAHELRTPLTPLRAYVHQLQKKSDKGEPVGEEMIARITRQVDRVVALAENLSDTARLDAGTALGIEREDVDLCTAIRGIVDERSAALERGPSTRVRPTLSLQAGEACPVFADPARIAQAFRHVLDNAIKFSPKGGDIHVSVEQDAEKIRIVTTDQGIGVPGPELERVGSKYFRASNAPAANFAGVGLGLALTKEIMTAHGGTLLASSNPEGGVVVTLSLPRTVGVS